MIKRENLTAFWDFPNSVKGICSKPSTKPSFIQKSFQTPSKNYSESGQISRPGKNKRGNEETHFEVYSIENFHEYQWIYLFGSKAEHEIMYNWYSVKRKSPLLWLASFATRKNAVLRLGPQEKPILSVPFMLKSGAPSLPTPFSPLNCHSGTPAKLLGFIGTSGRKQCKKIHLIFSQQNGVYRLALFQAANLFLPCSSECQLHKTINVENKIEMPWSLANWVFCYVAILHTQWLLSKTMSYLIFRYNICMLCKNEGGQN